MMTTALNTSPLRSAHTLLNITTYSIVKASPNMTKLAISIETRIDPNLISTSAVDTDFDSGLPRSD